MNEMVCRESGKIVASRSCMPWDILEHGRLLPTIQHDNEHDGPQLSHGYTTDESVTRRSPTPDTEPRPLVTRLT
jgi:hypothetical protein